MLDPQSTFYSKYHVGSLQSYTDNRNDTLYFELKRNVEAYMAQHDMKPRDIWWFDIEVLFFIIVTFVTYYLLLNTSNNNVLLSILYSILHGISITFMITRTIHDCNHGGLTKKSSWKRYLFTFINEIFTTNQSWNSKHNLHHMHTNDIDKDPDVNQMFRLSYHQPLENHHFLQYIYVFFLYPFFTLSQISGYRYVADNEAEPIHKLYRPIAKIILVIIILLAIRFNKLSYWLLAMLISGFYLSIVFTVSHNIDYLTDQHRNTNSFMEEQLTSTTDYNPGSYVTNFITHGLNHQTIHHLFPSINYHHYPALTQHVLIPFCKKHNLTYHGEGISFSQLLYRHVVSLYRWGTQNPQQNQFNAKHHL